MTRRRLRAWMRRNQLRMQRVVWSLLELIGLGLIVLAVHRFDETLALLVAGLLIVVACQTRGVR